MNSPGVRWERQGLARSYLFQSFWSQKVSPRCYLGDKRCPISFSLVVGSANMQAILSVDSTTS
jgi:hypothetical protein